jgi:hypothetical protein
MRRIGILLSFSVALIVFTGVPLQKSLADDKWQPEEIERLMRLNNGVVTVRLEGDTIFISASGEKTNINSSLIKVNNHQLITSDNSDRNCDPNTFALALQNSGIKKSTIAKKLIDILYESLFEMEQAKSYDYSKTDPIFRELIDTLANLDWTNKDVRWWPLSEGLTSLDKLGFIAYRSGKRYGVPILEILTAMQNQYTSVELPDEWEERRELLVEDLKRSIAHTIMSLLLEAEGVPLEERLDMASKKSLARELVKLYDEGYIFFYDSDLEKLGKLDPKIVRDIEYIKIEHEFKNSR